MTQYGGIDLLLIAPNAVSSWGSTVIVPADGMATDVGNAVTTSTGAPRTTAFTLTWSVAARADLATLETFLAARVGQLVPCWIPTYQRDMEYLAGVPFYGDVVTANPFSALLATEPHMRYWISRSPGGALFRTHYWNTYFDPADGTHVWGVTSGAGPAEAFSGSFNTFLWSRLMYCRMATDAYAVRYLGRASVVTADFLEVAGELDS